jgi:hypothetical protein
MTIDPESGMPAVPACPKTRNEVYIAGTEPVGVCPLHGGRGGITTNSGWDTTPPPATPPSGSTAPVVTGSQGDGQLPADSVARRAARQAAAGRQPNTTPPPPETPTKDNNKKPEKKGIFQRIFGVFK